ncbi:Vitamin B12 transporter BtuB [Alphaproteobacteria bacterium SO-S41]|nr:Vitamin B12 transporter BtuB [Alphaproteobacteria bacterium SO-S41]
MKSLDLKWHLLQSVAFAAVLVAPAYAQSGTTTPAEPATEQSDGSEEVVVTARRVTERAQDVPLSVSTLTPDQIGKGGQPSVESLSNAAPTVKIFKTVNQTGSYAVYIRGLGRDNGNFNVEAPVAFYVDDVLYPYQVGPVLDVGGISRIEVLRGPQGTLYGRSATVGAVKYITTRPDLDKEAIEGAVTVGSYGRAEVTAGVSEPIIEGKAAVRLDAGYRLYDGYIEDRRRNVTVNGTNGYGARLSINYQINENLNLYAALDGRHDRDEPNIATAQVLTGTTITPRFGSDYIAETNATDPLLNQLDAGGGTFQLKYDWDNVTLKSVTAYRGFSLLYSNDVVARADVAYSGTVSDVNDRTFTQEFQATGSLFDDRVTFVGGLFYLDSSSDAVVNQPGLATRPTYTTHQDARTLAAYLDVTAHIFAGLSLSAGVRYDDDQKEATQRTVSTALDFTKSAEAGWDSTTWRVGAEYKFTDNFMIYGSMSTGYKSGALNSLTPSVVGAAGIFVPPEHVDNTEIGFKSQWWDNRITLNVDYFWASYKDQTSAILDAKLATLLIAADADVEGVEVEFRLRPTENWSISGNLASMEGKYVNIDPLNVTLATLADKTPKHVPKLTYSINTDYTFDNVIQEGSSLRLSASYNYISKTYECLNHHPSCVSEPYGLTDISASYLFPDGHSEIIIAGTNVGDVDYFKVASQTPVRWIAAPAEFMLTFRYRN